MRPLNRFLYIALSSLVFAACDTPKELEEDYKNFFVKYYGGDGNQEGVDMLVNTDGTVMLLGNSESTREGKQYFVVKIDSDGKTIWKKTYGEIGVDEVAVDIEATSNGDYVIAVQKTIISNVDINVQIKQIRNSDGFGLDSAIQGYPNEIDLVRSLTVLTDGDIVMTGSTTQALQNDELQRLFFFRCNQGLDFGEDEANWFTNSTFAQGNLNIGVKMHEDLEYTGDITKPRFFLFYYTDATGLGNVDENFAVVAIGDDGNTGAQEILTDVLTDLNNDALSQALLAPNIDGYALVGTSRSPGGSSEIKILLVRGELSDNFPNAVQNSENITIDLPNDFEGISVVPSVRGGYIILAQEIQTIGSTQSRNLALVRVSRNTSDPEVTRFGSNFNSFGGKIAELPSGKILMLGTVTLDSQKKMALIKVNADGRFSE